MCASRKTLVFSVCFLGNLLLDHPTLVALFHITASSIRMLIRSVIKMAVLSWWSLNGMKSSFV